MNEIPGEKYSEIQKIGIIGDGRFAEALAYLLSKVREDVEIVLWTYKEEYEARANEKGTFRHSKKKKNKVGFRKPLKLPKNVQITHDEKSVVEGADILFTTLPAQNTREVMDTVFRDLIRENWGEIRAIISGTKGIEKGTNQRMSEVLQSTFASEGIDVLEKFGVLSGLNFAKDILYDGPMVANIASANKEVQSAGTDALLHEDFVVFPTDDVCGAEIVGALKNVIAIAVGAAKGLKGRDSTLHALIAAGIDEVKQFALAFGAQEKTFSAMRPTMRDLEGTATSHQSRNRQEGFTRAKREKREKTGVAEGVKTVEAVMALAQEKGIEMPVCEAVYKMVQKEESVRESMEELNQKLHDRAKKVAHISRERVANGKKKT